MDFHSFSESVGKALLSGIIGLTAILSGSSSSAIFTTHTQPAAPQQKPTPHGKVLPLPSLKKQPLAKIAVIYNKKNSTLTTTTVRPVILKNIPTSTDSQKKPVNPSIIPSPAPTLSQTPSTTTITTIYLNSTDSSTNVPTNIGSSTIKIYTGATTTSDATALQYESLPTDTVQILNRIQNSVVNIYCTSRQGNSIKVVTGSGVVIDPRGVILTNAHVAQYVLLQKDFASTNLTCVARIGSPASQSYDLDILYISPKWVEENYTNLAESSPKETGQYDFALLKMRTDSSAKKNFTYLPIGNIDSSPTISQKIVLSAYPGGILGREGISALLRSTIDQTSINDVYSFDGSVPDLIETGTSPLAEAGSSGGVIADSKGNIIGLITTILKDNSSSQYYIHGITTHHINETLKTYKWTSLAQFLSYDTNVLRDDFNSAQRARLESILLAGLKIGQ